MSVRKSAVTVASCTGVALILASTVWAAIVRGIATDSVEGVGQYRDVVNVSVQFDSDRGAAELLVRFSQPIPRLSSLSDKTTAILQVWLRSSGGRGCTARLDDLEFRTDPSSTVVLVLQRDLPRRHGIGQHRKIDKRTLVMYFKHPKLRGLTYRCAVAQTRSYFTKKMVIYDSLDSPIYLK